MGKNKEKVSPGWAKFCGWLLRRMGWESVGGPMKEPKAIVLGVPHTSVWDFLVSYLFYSQYGHVAHIMIKKEFFFWPLGPILRACGAVPVDRSNASTLVRSLIHSMNESDTFYLAIAPEGTRKPVRRWKSGYHLIARETGVPVYLGYFDWKRKRVGRGQKFPLTDDAAADTRRIQEIYESMDLGAKHPEKYVTH